MMILHKVSKSPIHSSDFEDCLQISRSGHSILLTGNGVYGVLSDAPIATKIQLALKDIKIYALNDDLIARGLAHRVIKGIEIINYEEFVELVVKHTSVCNWD